MPRLITAHRIAFCACLVFIASFFVLAWDIDRSGIAAAYNDPVARIRAQDEAPIVSATIRMTQDSDWMTPKLMGRPFILMPPMLIWLSALSVRLMGLSLLSIRMPVLLLGSAGIAAVFAWAARARSIPAGVLAGGGVLLSPLWQIVSRGSLTDVLAGSFAALALAGVALDPQLIHRRTRVAFGLMSAASILSKSVAGVLPVAVLLLFFAIVPREQRPRFSSVAESMAWTTIFAAPWFIHQGMVHPKWLWADCFQNQLITTGLHWDRNSTIGSSHVRYYLIRLMQTDPLALALAVAGLAGALRISRLRQQPLALLAACWASVTAAALCAFQSSSLPYMALVLPSLCTFGGVCGPRLLDKRPVVTLCALFVWLIAKVEANGQPWSLRPTAPLLAGAQAMRDYYSLNRHAELISVDPDDELYSLTIPLARMRYCALDPTGVLERFAPHYLQLGIIVTSRQFLSLPTLAPGYEKRLHEWGVDTPEPIASTITISSPAEISEIVNASPESDFYLPAGWLGAIASPERDHQLVRYSSGRIFLLSRTAKSRAQPLQPLPRHW